MTDRGRAVLFLGALLPVAAAAAETSRFAVGSASAERGKKATGYLDVPAGVDAATQIPVVVVNGARPGPVLALVSGAHGTEYASIIALEKVIARLDPAEVSGTVIVLPLVNLPSFLRKVPHVNPVDEKSMNRFYPGKADGTQTERASFRITQEVVDRCDYLIDYHGGDLNTASLRGKPSIVVEAGHAGTVEPEDVRRLVDGTASVMRLLKMLPGEPTPVEHPVWIEKLLTVTSEGTGIFYPLVQRGTYVAAGMKLGYVTDWFGATLSEPTAPGAGVVLYVDAVPTMKKGDNVAIIGVPAAQAP
jgi:uncharacterized protein